MKNFPFLKTIALGAVSCACVIDASAAKQVYRTEKFGDGYTFGPEQCVSTSDYITDLSGRTLLSSYVTHNGTGSQLSSRTVTTYADDGLSSVATSQIIKQRNINSDSEGDLIEFEWANNLRTFSFYDSEGRVLRTYGQKWDSTISDWSESFGEGWEYCYDNSGLMTDASYWIAYNPDEAPRYSFRITYDGQGRINEVYRDGSTDYSPMHLTLTWGEDGKLQRLDQEDCSGKDSDGNPKWREGCYYLYEYDGGLLTDWVKYSYQNKDYVPTVKNVYEYSGNGTFATYATSLGIQGINYIVDTTDYDSVITYNVNKISVNADGTVRWTNPSIKNVSYMTDYDSPNALTAASLTATPGEGVGEVLVSFNIPKSSNDVKVVLYRDCEVVFTKTPEELGDAYDAAGGNVVYHDKASNGDHTYAVVLLTTDAAGNEYRGHIEGVANVSVATTLPLPGNLRVDKIRQKEQTVSGTDENGHFVTQKIINNIVTLRWDPISEADAETYGFKKYEIWSNSYKGAIGYTSDFSRKTYDVNFGQSTEGDVWLEIDYGMGRTKTEKIHVNVNGNTPVTDKAEVWGIAKILNPENFDSSLSMVKGDLNDKDSTPEQILDLYNYDSLHISDFKGGTSVGEYYFANMIDDNGASALYSLNFTDKEVVRVHDYKNEELGYGAGNFAYDGNSGILYATESTYNADIDDFVNALMIIDYSGNGKALQVATLTDNPYLMTAGDGVIYAALMSGSFSNYKLTINTLDPATGKLTALEGIPSFTVTNSYDKAIAYNNGKLYITVGTSYYLVDLPNKSVTTMPSVKRAYNALTFTCSTLSAEPAGDDPVPASDSRKLYRTANYGDSMGVNPDSETVQTLYYYNTRGNISREVTSSRTSVNNVLTDNWHIDYLTSYDYNESGKLVEKNKYQYGMYDNDMTQRQLSSSTAYSYDEAGNLANETETCPSNIIGMSDRVKSTDYTYDASGNILTKQISNDGSVNETYSYTYEDGRLTTAECSAYGEKTTDNYAYDEAGRLAFIEKINAKSQLINRKVYEYFADSDILSSEAEYYSFDRQGNPTEGSRRVTEAVDGNTDMLLSKSESLFDGVWYDESGTTRISYYSDFEGMAEIVATDLKVEKGDGINEAILEFALPQAMMVSNNSLVNVIRDGESVARYTVTDIVNDGMLDQESMTVSLSDNLVANGEHEYFVQVMFSQSGDIEPFDLEINIPEYIGYNISNIETITFDTEIPAVNNFSVKGYEKVYVDAYDKPVSNPLLADHQAYKVTMSWTNPADCEAFGFISHNVYETPFLQSIAKVEDATSNEATFIIQETGLADVYVRSNYKIGYADSEIFAINIHESGVAETEISGNRIEDGMLILSSASDVEVFDVAGRRLMSLRNVESADLRSLDGMVVIIIKDAKKNETIKTTL